MGGPRSNARPEHQQGKGHKKGRIRDRRTNAQRDEGANGRKMAGLLKQPFDSLGVHAKRISPYEVGVGAREVFIGKNRTWD